jgi:hypothetical protein
VGALCCPLAQDLYRMQLMQQRWSLCLNNCGHDTSYLRKILERASVSSEEVVLARRMIYRRGVSRLAGPTDR